MKRAASASPSPPPSPINPGPRRSQRPTPGSAGACAPSTVRNAPLPAAAAAPGQSVRSDNTPAASTLPLALLDHLCPALVHEARRELGLLAHRFPAHLHDRLVEGLVNRIRNHADRLPAVQQHPAPQQLQVRLFEEVDPGTGHNVLYAAAWDVRSPPPSLAPLPLLAPGQWRPDDPLSTGISGSDLRRAQIMFRIRMNPR